MLAPEKLCFTLHIFALKRAINMENTAKSEKQISLVKLCFTSSIPCMQKWGSKKDVTYLDRTQIEFPLSYHTINSDKLYYEYALEPLPGHPFNHNTLTCSRAKREASMRPIRPQISRSITDAARAGCCKSNDINCKASIRT